VSGDLVVEGLTREFRLPRRGLWGRSATLRAVDDVSFTVPAGQILGLVGESGCGKSTTARLVLGLIPPSAGKVRFGGHPVSARIDADWRRMRRRIQMIYQDPLSALDRRLTARHQIEEPLVVHADNLSPAQRAARVDEALEHVGLSRTMAERYPHELSGGQRQRVVIARALVLEPALLVCDEPVSALDVSVQAQVLNLFQNLRRKTGFTSLFISHDLKVVRQVADRVAVMYLGRIVETGAPEDVFHRPAHPYTQALVSAIPDPRHRGRKRILLEGDPPNPADVPAGCAFHKRCPAARAECKTLRPTLLPKGARSVACHLVHPPWGQ